MKPKFPIDMGIDLNAGIVLLASGLIFLLFLSTLPWLCCRTDFLSMLRHHLRRFTPLYFVAGPSAITYFAVTPCACIFIMMIFFNVHQTSSQQYANEHGLYNMLHWAELLSSFFGTLFFAWLIRWLGLSRLWTIMLFVSMSVCAAYRTARVGTDSDFSSGPEILLSPQWLDAIPVVLGLGLFLLLSQKADRQRRAVTVTS